jgi:hypothetical protein
MLFAAVLFGGVLASTQEGQDAQFMRACGVSEFACSCQDKGRCRGSSGTRCNRCCLAGVMAGGDGCGDHAVCLNGNCQCVGSFQGPGDNCDGGGCCPLFAPTNATSESLLLAHADLKRVQSMLTSIRTLAQNEINHLNSK